MLVLGKIPTLFVGLTSLVGAFAGGGNVWQRLSTVLSHPLVVAGVLLLVLANRPTGTATLGIVAALLAKVISDVALTRQRAGGCRVVSTGVIDLQGKRPIALGRS